MKQNLLKFSMLLLFMVTTVSLRAVDITIAEGTFNGKNATYTTGWSTTGTGTGRTDCVVVGKGENITSPALNLSGYDEIKITFTGRRYGTLTNSKATVDAAIGGTSVGTIDITNGSVGNVSGNITFTPTSSMTSVNIVFTCTNAASAGSTHGAGVGSITITGTKNNSEAYKVTFVSGENGNCEYEDITETAASAGITLPSCTPKSGYVFDGWSASSEATSSDNGLDAGKTYYPTADITLYAVYSKIGVPFTLVFKESGSASDSSTKYPNTVANIFSTGVDYVSSVSNLSNVYPAQTGRGSKFGTSNSAGTVTINLKKAVTIGKIVVVCAGYKDGEANGFTINGTKISSTTYAASDFEELTYNTAGSISSITIATQSKRGYVKSIKVYPVGSYAELSISSAGYATYVTPFAIDFSQTEDITAYVLSSKTSEKVTLTPVEKVPANQAVIVKGEKGTYTVTYAESADAVTNLLTYSTEAIDYDANSENTYYVLALQGENVVFAPVNEGTIAAGKGYFTMPKSSDAKALNISFADATAITNVSVGKAADGATYNVSGQRVDGSYKGIIIKNGKKYMNK